MPEDSFPFTYSGDQYEAQAECLPSVNGFRRYRLNFPNVQIIVEGSVSMAENVGSPKVRQLGIRENL